jgi:hypothetical protein
MKMSKDDDDPENYIYGPESKKFERCHDVPCLLLFGVAWVGLLAVMIVAFVLGVRTHPQLYPAPLPLHGR